MKKFIIWVNLFFVISFALGQQNDQINSDIPPLSRTRIDGTTFFTYIRDFQVNENDGLDSFKDIYSSVAVSNSGRFIVVWEDNRAGKFNIFAQIYTIDGNPVGENFVVNDNESWLSTSGSPLSVSASDSSFIIVWRDLRNIFVYDIYAQLFTLDGKSIGGNFKVNDDSSSVSFSIPSVSMDPSGNFVVVWEDQRNANNDIYAQRYAADGTPLGVNFKINDDSISAWHGSPDIAIDPSGNFVVVWSDDRNGDADIYAQRYAADGTPLGSNFKINDDSVSAVQYSPSIAIDGFGNFVAVWTDKRNDPEGDIYAQRYLWDGTALGENFKVNDDNQHAKQKTPSVAMDDSGNFFVVWEDRRNSFLGDIYAQFYAKNGSATSKNFKVNDDTNAKGQNEPSVAVNNSGNFVVIWNDYRNSYFSNIFIQLYAQNGTPLGNNFMNNESGTSKQIKPSIAVDAQGNFAIVWEDARYDNHIDIFGQRFTSNGTALGKNFKINDDNDFSHQNSPAIAMGSSGNFIVVWVDERDDFRGDIYAQRYAADGTALGGNFKVNDDSGSNLQDDPVVVIDKNGNFIILWIDTRNGSSNIYAQRYDFNGTALGGNFKLNNDNSRFSSSFSVGMDGSGNIIVVWEDYRDDDKLDVFGQKFSQDGTALGNDFKVNNDHGNNYQFDPKIAVNSSGDFVVVWSDYRDHEYGDVFAQLYSSDGTTIGNNFKVNDSIFLSNDQPNYISVSMDNRGNFIIVWSYYNDIYAQRYAMDGTPIDQNFRINKIRIREQFSPDVKLFNNNIYSTWVSNYHIVTGYDIWANVLDWNNPTGIEIKSKSVITNFRLSQNYPNPFNPTTTIRYALPKAARVELTIYNTLGQKVRTLVQKKQPAGQYQVQWDGRDKQGRAVPSGVYLYKLKAGDFVQAKKMLLVR